MTRSAKQRLSIKVLLEVWEKTDGRCFYCGGEALTVDHVFPVSKGGTHSATNLLPACGRCNSAKRDRHIDDFRRSRGVKFTARQIEWLVDKYGMPMRDLLHAEEDYSFWGDADHGHLLDAIECLSDAP